MAIQKFNVSFWPFGNSAYLYGHSAEPMPNEYIQFPDGRWNLLVGPRNMMNFQMAIGMNWFLQKSYRNTLNFWMTIRIPKTQRHTLKFLNENPTCSFGHSDIQCIPAAIQKEPTHSISLSELLFLDYPRFLVPCKSAAGHQEEQVQDRLSQRHLTLTNSRDVLCSHAWETHRRRES